MAKGEFVAAILNYCGILVAPVVNSKATEKAFEPLHKFSIGVSEQNPNYQISRESIENTHKSQSDAPASASITYRDIAALEYFCPSSFSTYGPPPGLHGVSLVLPSYYKNNVMDYFIDVSRVGISVTNDRKSKSKSVSPITSNHGDNASFALGAYYERECFLIRELV